MNDTTTTYASQLNTLTTTYQTAVSTALVGPAASLRSDDSTDLMNATLAVLSGQCLAIDQAAAATKTDDVEFSSQVNCINDVLDTLAALEAKKAGSDATLTVAAKALSSAGETLASGLDGLAGQISAAIVPGYSNPDAATAGAQAVFQNSVKNYNAMVDDVLAQAKTAFRTVDGTAVLTASIAALSATLAQADKTPMTVDEGQALALKASQQLVTLQSKFRTVQAADLTYIESNKVPTLDQPILRPYAEMLKNVDESFSQELSSLFGETSVDPGDAKELDAAVKASASLNVPNTPAPDTAKS
jgi:hypothetical protein